MTKDEKIKMLSPVQRKVYNLLCTGHYGTLEIMERLRVASPRRLICSIKSKGLDVASYWCVGKDTRFKKYFINPKY
jgi:hypothetical protein